MTFWKTFFRRSIFLHTNNNQCVQDPQSDELLIQKLNYKNNIVDIYLSTDKYVNLIELEKLCDSVGWVRRPISKVKIAMQNSFLIISLVRKIDSTRHLVGFARATSDHAFNATIWDVVIHPEFQGYGLGATLMHQLIQKLRYAEISTITLFADPNVISFYHNLGFISDPDGVKGMFWYPR